MLKTIYPPNYFNILKKEKDPSLNALNESELSESVCEMTEYGFYYLNMEGGQPI